MQESRFRSPDRPGCECKQGDEYHDGRLIWYPLSDHSEQERDILVEKTPLQVLPHRSMECCPCVNANKIDLLMVEKHRIEEIRTLETVVGKNMFRAKKKWVRKEWTKLLCGQGPLEGSLAKTRNLRHVLPECVECR